MVELAELAGEVVGGVHGAEGGEDFVGVALGEELVGFVAAEGLNVEGVAIGRGEGIGFVVFDDLGPFVPIAAVLVGAHKQEANARIKQEAAEGAEADLDFFTEGSEGSEGASALPPADGSAGRFALP